MTESTRLFIARQEDCSNSSYIRYATIHGWTSSLSVKSVYANKLYCHSLSCTSTVTKFEGFKLKVNSRLIKFCCSLLLEI